MAMFPTPPNKVLNMPTIALPLRQQREPQREASTPKELASVRRFIKLPAVRELTTLSTSEIYRRISLGAFPKQVTLGPKSAVWIEEEVVAWVEARIAERHDNEVA